MKFFKNVCKTKIFRWMVVRIRLWRNPWRESWWCLSSNAWKCQSFTQQKFIISINSSQFWNKKVFQSWIVTELRKGREITNIAKQSKKLNLSSDTNWFFLSIPANFHIFSAAPARDGSNSDVLCQSKIVFSRYFHYHFLIISFIS